MALRPGVWVGDRKFPKEERNRTVSVGDLAAVEGNTGKGRRGVNANCRKPSRRRNQFHEQLIDTKGLLSAIATKQGSSVLQWRLQSWDPN